MLNTSLDSSLQLPAPCGCLRFLTERQQLLFSRLLYFFNRVVPGPWLRGSELSERKNRKRNNWGAVVGVLVLCCRQLSDETIFPRSVEAKEQRELFRSRAILFEPTGRRLPPGRYRFPFLFVLPSDIPGSASVAGADVGRDEAGESVASLSCVATPCLLSLCLSIEPFSSTQPDACSSASNAFCCHCEGQIENSRISRSCILGVCCVVGFVVLNPQLMGVCLSEVLPADIMPR